MGKTYALLVGINDYSGDIGKLQGCINDIENVNEYLTEALDDPGIVMLKDHDATRDNLAKQFREHLGRAGKDDVALFHYCGHGARSLSAPEWREFDLTGKDEGLVCIDSRGPGQFDFADKELALLLQEIAPNDAHVAIILDCCQSGSGTRSLEGSSGAGARVTEGVDVPRPLESYIGGHFAQLHQNGKALSVPASRHMLLAACDRRQTAKEDLDTHRGIFTTALYDLLRRVGDPISYADLFVRSRAAVRQYIRDNDKTPQDPQFEAIGGFDGHSGFLGRATQRRRKTYSVGYVNERWQVDCGAINGLPIDPAQPATFRLLSEAGGAAEGTATATSVGAQQSDIAVDFAADPAKHYVAEITSLPGPPLMIGFNGSDDIRTALALAIDADDSANLVLVDPSDDLVYNIVASEIGLKLSSAQRGGDIRSVPMGQNNPNWPAQAVQLLNHVTNWERSLKLSNPNPQLDADLVDFVFAEKLEDGSEHVHKGPEFTLESRKVGEQWQEVVGKLKLRNRTPQMLHFALIHYGADFGARVITNEQVEPNESFMTVNVGTGPNASESYFSVDRDNAQSVECLKMILSTERVDDFLLDIEPLSDERAFGSAENLPSRAAKPLERDWFTKDLRVTVVRQQDGIGPKDVKIADGQIKIKAHPSVTASLSISGAQSMARSVGGDAAMVAALSRNGLQLINLAGTRDAAQNILELTDITNASSLKENPIEIELAVPLKPQETLMPLVYDGQHVLLAGDSWRDDDGVTRISIDSLPEMAIDRRSIGGALKMYLFKTYLGQENVNQLRAATFDAKGGYELDDSGLAAKVATARSVLLVVHGIIGDTAALLTGVAACGLDRQFDLVLAYDYENLNTPIEQTARLLKNQMSAAGLHGIDNKQLTILAHSMGGLVSRWLIQREGGDTVVDHLVMCGTPNQGSPFGRIDSARKLLSMLATIGVNYVPMLAAPALFLLSRSKKLSPTLEQMNPASEFITTLNASPPNPVRTTILAGDIDSYNEPADGFFEDLLAKAGRGELFDLLFANKANDIAVGVESILGADAAEPPVRTNVACHHLNYFSSTSGQSALKAVEWAV